MLPCREMCLEMAPIGRQRRAGFAGRNDMNRCCAVLAIAIVVAFGGRAAPAIAAPPTATPSPGYDARLQESRAARTVYAPVVRAGKPVPQRRVKRMRAQ
jgi:hypothetical protein